MDIFESRFERDLMRLIAEARKERVSGIVSGNAETIAEYREAVGYIRALDWVCQVAADVRKTIYGTYDVE